MAINRDELAARLLQMFSAELEDQVVLLDAHLVALEARPDDPAEAKAVFRVLHTLKGAARAAGVKEVEDVCHDLESLLAHIRDNRGVIDKEVIEKLSKGADVLAAESDRLRKGSAKKTASTMPAEAVVSDNIIKEDPSPIIDPVPVIEDSFGSVDISSSPSQSLSPSQAQASSPQSSPSLPSLPSLPSSQPQPSSPSPQAIDDVKVSADQLYELLRSSSELYVYVGGVRDLADELDTLRTKIGRLSSERYAEDTAHLRSEISNLYRDVNRISIRSKEVLRSLGGISTDVGSRVRRLRMRPFSDISSIFNRVVKDAAQETKKSVKLIIEGNEIQADRTVLDEMREAIMHIARNSVAHGIELPTVREDSGKSITGTVKISAKVVVDHIVVTISDDGAGINVRAITRAMEQRGIPVPATRNEFVQRLFEGGVSTQAEADLIAGRGVGLDAVRVAMSKIRGSYNVSWVEGQGTTFTLDAPVSLATIRGVLVKVGAHIIAIPDAYIERLQNVKASQVRHVDGKNTIAGIQENGTPSAPIILLSLARLLGPPFSEKPLDRSANAVIVEVQQQKFALIVDELIGEEEIVIKPISGKGKRNISHVSGATLLRNGKVALVANIGSLVNGAAIDSSSSSGWAFNVQDSGSSVKKRIIVADDSITTRTLEQSVLESSGYEVRTAVDGVEAWQMLQEFGADLIVSDVEMPRMDGFSLCLAVKASAKFREIPLVLVTALENESDKERGAEVGADAYLTKSSFDQAELLDTIRQLLS